MEIKNLFVEYVSDKNAFGGKQIIHAVNGVSLDVKKGEILAIAGESGCGKSTLARAILRLENSKSGEIDFEGKGNPLTKAGIIFSVNQLLYILIAMWVFAAVPEKMLMVYAMIFGAHLMPFSWLYQSRSYMVFSIFIPIVTLIVGLFCQPAVLAALMLAIEIVFSLCLSHEVKQLSSMS